MALTYDPTNPSVRENPYPYYAELRRDSPVYRIPSLGCWALSRYDDVMRVVKDPSTFSSAPMSFEAPARAVFGDLFPDPLPKVLIAADPPEHTRLREIVKRAFAPRRIADLETRVRVIARALLESISSSSEPSFDFVAELSAPLPVMVISEMLGVEPERHRDFKRWSDAIVTGISGIPAPEQLTELASAGAELSLYIREAIAERRKRRGDDLISVLVDTAGTDEQPLTPDETIFFTLLLLVAGNETTTTLLSNAILALLANPDQLTKVASDPSRVPALVEETLRYDSPVQALFRLATTDVQMHGQQIRAGDIVMPLFASANRDESHFEDPDRFDIERKELDHVAFGYGIHFCLGASLARLEARVVLEEIRRLLPQLALVTDAVERIDSVILRGPKTLPLVYRGIGRPRRTGLPNETSLLG
jgi:cytochrome P450